MTNKYCITDIFIKICLFISFIGNIVDIVSTLYLSHLGYYEINPIMRWLIQYPLYFIIIKFSLMLLVLLWLWSERQYKLANIAIMITTGLYGGLILYYIIFFMKI